MRDVVSLRINNVEVSHFTNYSIEADLYTAADGFTLELSDPLAPIAAGDVVTLYVNGTRELIGTIDTREPYNDKAGSRLTLTGRDVCGWLADAYCEEFITLENVTLQALAERLLKNAPSFVTAGGIIYQQNLIGNLKRKKAKKASPASILWAQDGGQAKAQIQPGQTVFEVLKIYAQSRGMMFYALPDGTLVFGQPLMGGPPMYYLTRRRDNAAGNNIEKGGLKEDLSKRYSKIKVIGQRQGTDTDIYNYTAQGAAASLPGIREASRYSTLHSRFTSLSWHSTITTPARPIFTGRCSSKR